MTPPRLKAPRRARAITASLGATVLIAAAAVAGCGSSNSSTTGSTNSGTKTPEGFTYKAFASGVATTITTPSGTVSITQPDDITALNGNVYVGFQNNVGTMGEPAAKGTTGAGGLDSTVVKFSSSGSPLAHWNVAGHLDGLTADPGTGKVIVTTNEDGNARLFLIDPSSSQAVEYHLPAKLPHGGGLDAIAIWKGMILISASAPSAKAGPAVYVVSLNSSNMMASVRGLFAVNATATPANTGAPTHLALTDPDSNAVVPTSAPRFGGQFELTSQGDLLQIFTGDTTGKQLSVLKLSQAVDDSVWATSTSGTLYVTEGGSDLIWKVTGPFKTGTEIVAVAPCNANSAPTACPHPPTYPNNYLGQVNMSTGAVTAYGGTTIQAKGMVFVP